jgi:glycosyltransferase involved in cell wall biosynthesis
VNGKFKGVSVLVAAHNELQNLKNLIPAILAQDHTEFELIIALDRSNDGSEQYLKSLSDQRIKVLVISEVPNDYHPKKYALSRGIEIARHEILLLTDADCIPLSTQWIKEMTKLFEKQVQIVVGYSPYERKNDFLNLFIRFETFLTGVQYLSFVIVGLPYMGVGRNLAYTKDLFSGNFGFKGIKKITGGDDDLFIGKVSTKRNCTVAISKNSQVVSVPKTTWGAFFKQKTRHLSVGNNYKTGNRIKSALYPGSQLMLYFSFISLFYFNVNISYIGGTFMLRTLVLIIIFALITRKLGDTIRWFWFPLLDLLYTIIYLVTGISAILSKNIKWK